MKALNHNFSKREKILVLILALLLVALVYYQFVYKQAISTIQTANSEAESLQIEADTYGLKIQQLDKMADELESITSDPEVSTMGSYNNSKAEVALLNQVFADTVDYDISFQDVTRDGDQIRRPVTFSFVVNQWSEMENILTELSESSQRCLLEDISCTTSKADNAEKADKITVTGTATFYETMADGTADAGLPEDETEVPVDEDEELSE